MSKAFSVTSLKNHKIAAAFISANDLLDLEIVSNVFPFKVNSYVLENLIDWENYTNDPVFKIVFPNKKFLSESDFSLIKENLNSDELGSIVANIQQKLNPDPSAQSSYIPILNNSLIEGLQHKYDSTLLVFPKSGQTCHAYCSFCFRWPQFVKLSDKHQLNDVSELTNYLNKNYQITDLILTGGDPMIMNFKNFKQIVDAVINSKNGVVNFRIGTKSLVYHPMKYTEDTEAKDFIDYFKFIISKGYSLNFMLHVNHANEMKPQSFEHAVKAIQSTGAVIRSQSPILAGINDNFQSWYDLITTQVKLGIVPYYMFLPRDTGANKNFKVSIEQALEIFNQLMQNVSGLSKTLRGPVMSTKFGKISIDSKELINNEDVFICKMIQSPTKELNNKIFFAKSETNASWITDLKPFGTQKFIFE